MSSISVLLYALLLAAGFPVGLFLTNLCKEEIKNWKKRLLIIPLVSLLLSIAFFFTNFEFKIPIIISLFFIIITCLIIVWKSNS